MNHSEIETVLRQLYHITGFRVSLHASDYSEIEAYPKEVLPFCAHIHNFPGELERCVECDRAACEEALRRGETVIYRCHFGLTEAISPLFNFGVLTGFLIMGQIRSGDLRNWEKLRKLFPEEAERAEITKRIPLVDPVLIPDYVNIMTLCARYLTISNAITTEKPSLAETARNYLYKNYQSRICVRDLCQVLGCSRSNLFAAYKKRYGTTVHETLTEVRLQAAERRLCGSDAPISEVAEQCGFSDQSYFTKVFAARYGKVPSEYRKERQTGEGSSGRDTAR